MALRRANIKLSTFEKVGDGEYAMDDDFSGVVCIRYPDLDMVIAKLVVDKQEFDCTAINVESKKGARRLTATVTLAGNGLPKLEPGKLVRFNDEPMTVVDGDADSLRLVYATDTIHRGVKAKVTDGDKTIHLVCHDWSLEYNGDQCWLKMDATLGFVRWLATVLLPNIFRTLYGLANKPFAKKADPPPMPGATPPPRRWPKLMFSVLLGFAVVAILGVFGGDAYRCASSGIGGPFGPSPSASEQSASPKAIEPFCIPASDYNVLRYFLQSDPKRLVGKVSAYRYGHLGFYCGDNVQPPYDAAKKTSDVSACSICVPGEYSKPGKYAMTPDILEKMFFQKDPSCFVEPTLPFKPSLQTMRRGLRIDMDCKDYEYIADRGCYDYSKCAIIVP